MNILFFLTPKNEVTFIDSDVTLRQALEKLEANGYTALPMVNRQGKYVGTITEGDLLWYIKDHADLTLFDAEDVSLMKVRRRRDNSPVTISSSVESLFEKVMNQNFVPVIDDDGIFIGIVTRRDIVQLLASERKTAAAPAYRSVILADNN